MPDNYEDRLPGEPGGPQDLPDGGYQPGQTSGGKSDPADPSPIENLSDYTNPGPADSTSRLMFDTLPGSSTFPEPERAHCPVCRGTGWKMTTADFLRESLSVLEDRVGAAVELFYERLFTVAPHLEALFPDRVGQRDRLVAALTELGKRYDPTDRDAMDALRTILAGMGRAHSNFPEIPSRPAGPATLDEYMAVKSVLLPTLADVAFEVHPTAWLPVYTQAWSEAYDFAASHMMVAGFDSPQQFARTVRQ